MEWSDDESFGSSPRKKTQASSSPYDNSLSTAGKARVEMDRELSNFWIGPMPVQDFLNDFLPLTPGTTLPDAKSHFAIPACATEKELCEKFVNRVNDSSLNLIPNYKMELSCDESDKDEERKIRSDTDLYKATVDTSQHKNQTRFSEVKCELKNSNIDPFVDKPSQKEANPCFERTTDVGRDVRGQLATYASAVLSCQHRLHVFQVYIAYPSVRFIRADRAGIIVTNRLSIKTEEGSQALADFFYRFSHCNSDATRGWDPTVDMLEDGDKDAKLAREKLREYKKGPLERPILRFHVPDDQKIRKFLAWDSISNVDSVVGRATRVYPVYEVETNSVFMLKDSWRASSLEPESEILKKLNSFGREPTEGDKQEPIPNIPTLLCGGDVHGQATLTHLYASDDLVHPDPARTGIPPKAWKIGKHADDIIKRIHHRFVEKEIGKPLDSFTSTKQLVQVITDALIAHRAVYENCRILHRDISGKNILILPNGRGMLNDWDMAKSIDNKIVRYHQRTGTWQFIAAACLMDPTKVHDLQDDLESFILVAFYHVVRYTAHNQETSVPVIMYEIFNRAVVMNNGELLGGRAKRDMFLSRYLIGYHFSVGDNKPFNRWLNSLLYAGRERYKDLMHREDALHEAMYRDPDITLMTPESTGPSSSAAATGNPTTKTPSPSDLPLGSHDWLIKVSNLALNGDWPSNDRGKDLYPRTNRKSSKPSKSKTQTIQLDVNTSQTSLVAVSSLQSIGSANSLKRGLDDDDYDDYDYEFESDRDVKRARTPAEFM